MRAGSASVARRAAACVLISLLLTAVSAVLAPAGWFERLDGVVGDLAFPRGDPDPSVAVVAIDEQSLAEVDPEWPWPRERYAELVERLGDAGAEVVVLDLVLAAQRSGDPELTRAMEGVPTVLAVTSSSASSRPDEPVRVGTVVEVPGPLASSAAAAGHAQVDADPADGVARSVATVVETPDRRLVPSLALAALAVSDGGTPRPILRSGRGVQLGDRVVPTDDRYRLRISWPRGLPPADGADGPVLSAADVLSGDLDASQVEGRVVFLGVTDPTLGDQVATPVSRRVSDPGVMLQAAAYHTMASRQFLSEPSAARTAGWVAALSLLAALAVQFLPLLGAAVASLALVAAAMVVPVQAAASGAPLHSVYPLLAVALAIPLSGGVRYAAETRLRRRVSDLFARYVPPTVARELVRDGRVDAAAEGQRLDVSVFFCDLRGFTPLAASLEPAQVNRVLSHYYEYVSAAVLDAGGTIVQYVGDEVFAVFGAPLPRADHAAAALRCALGVQAGRSTLERSLRDEGLPMVDFGIGVNSGEVVAAHAGSSFRRQYSVIGDAVNVGSRLCNEARVGEVVAAAETVEAAADDPDVVPDGVAGDPYQAALKGVDRAVTAWRFGPADGVRPSDP